MISESSSKSQHQVESRLLLDVVIRKRPSIFQLLSSKNESLLIGGNTFLVLDLGLHILNCVRGLNIKGNSLSSQGLDEDLHTSSQSEDQMESGLLLDIIVRQSSSVLKLFPCEDESLLIRWDSFFVLDLGLDIFDGVRGLHIQSDGLAS